MKSSKFIFVFLFFLAPLFFASNIFASERIYLSPSTGQITGSRTPVKIMVDSAGVDMDSFEVTIKIEGDIKYLDFESGNIEGCPLGGGFREDTDDFFFYCLMWDVYSGGPEVLGTLYFEATAEGSATITITRAYGVEAADIGSPGVYTTTLSTLSPALAPSTDGVGSGEESTLPRTSYFSFFGIFLSILAFVFFFLLYSNNPQLKKMMVEKV